MARVLTECPGCHHAGVPHYGRGLCRLCYDTSRRRGLFIVGSPGESADELDVRLCLAGAVSARRINRASREQVVRILAGRGLTDAEIEERTRWRGRAGGRPGQSVQKFRERRSIPPGQPRYGWRYAS